MKRIVLFCILLLALLIIILAFLRDQTTSVKTDFTDLNREFSTCLPKNLSDKQRDEVAGILERFSQMAQKSKVEKPDQEEIEADLTRYIRLGEIKMKELEYFMAKVSYFTFKSDSNYNLPGGQVDHPLLNPEGN